MNGLHWFKYTLAGLMLKPNTEIIKEKIKDMIAILPSV